MKAAIGFCLMMLYGLVLNGEGPDLVAQGTTGGGAATNAGASAVVQHSGLCARCAQGGGVWYWQREAGQCEGCHEHTAVRGKGASATA